MGPLSGSVVTETISLEKTQTVPNKYFKVLKERTLEINFRNIINDIYYLDYSKVVWRNVGFMITIHICGLYGYYLAATSCYWKTFLFAYGLANFGGIGITAGAHRLWSHRSYKAKFPLRLILALGQTIAIQNDLYVWCRDHRVHHKFSETDADPHNAQRGFFFSHMGWLMMKKHPDVVNKGKTVDCSDLLKDPIIYYQRKYYALLVLAFGVFFPSFVPWYCWEEKVIDSIMVGIFMRYIWGLHCTWVVNSLAHWVGSKPYDKYIYPTQNSFVAYLAMGEGWHNYHHVFPYDYRASELGGHLGLNLCTIFLDYCAKFGWVYDRKIVPKEIIDRRMSRTGTQNN